MVPNPFLAKVIIKVVTSFTKSAIKAYSNTLRKNNAANGKRTFKFDWNDIFKHHKLNILNYIDASKFKEFNPFNKAQDAVMDKMSKNNSHKISEQEAVKILAIEPESKLTLKLVMEQYLLLYTKNKPETGGSAYIQAKVLNAKDMLIEQLGGLEAEMRWRATNGYQDDDNTVYEKKHEQAETEDKVVKNEEAMLEINLEHPKNQEDEEEDKRRKQEEESKKEEESDSDEDDDADAKKKKDKKEGEEEDKKEENVTPQQQSLSGEFAKYNEENPEQTTPEKDESIQDQEIDKLVEKMEKDEKP